MFVVEVKKHSLRLQVLSFDEHIISRGETLKGKSWPRISRRGSC